MNSFRLKQASSRSIYCSLSILVYDAFWLLAVLILMAFPSLAAFVPDAFVQRILQKKEFFKVYDYLKEMKAQGQILQFGPLKEVEDYSSLELILFDMQSKEVLTLLSPAIQGDVRTNLTTGTEDSLDNYPEDMLLVIWYIK